MFDLKKEYNGNLHWLTQNTILFGLAGSRSYNLSTPESDNDYKGIAIPTKPYFYGWLNHFEQAEHKNKETNTEFVIYDIRKFFSMAANVNPNILELLYLDPADYLILTPFGQRIIDNRDAFLSQKVVWTYTGYSVAQLKKIKLHRAHLLSPPKVEPKREDFGLPKDRALISRDQQGAFTELLDKNLLSKDEVSENFLNALQKEKAYFQAKRHWDQYQEWKRNRNPARAELEAKYGYDCKHACHLVRLLVQARELLTDGKLIVKRIYDRDFLMSIRNGAWEYERLIEWASKQEAQLMELVKKSPLPKEPDRKLLDELCIEIVDEFLRSS